jgi:hypothetical protein
MAYVEWLRVKKTLIVLAIVLGVLFLIAICVRISVDAQLGPNQVKSMVGDGATIVSAQALPDGGNRTTYKKTNGDTLVVTTTRDGMDAIETGPSIAESANTGARHMRHFGPFSVTRTKKTVEFDTGGPLDIGLLFSIVAIVGVIVATVLAAPLARENERLEVAWTKPIGRTLYALQLYGVGLVGIAASLVMSVIAAIAIFSLFEWPHLTLTADGGWHIALSFAAGAAWYGMYAAITSWMKRGVGAALGIAWPVALITPGLALAPIQVNAIGNAFHWVFQAIASIDPLAYLHLGTVGDHGREIGLAALDPALKLAILVALAVVYAVAGLIEWQRVEA